MGLRRSAVVESDDLAALRRRELDIPRERARELGQSALRAIREGWYPGPDGQPVDWRADIERAVAAKVSLPPDAPLPAPSRERVPEAHVLVANETTLGAARRLDDAGRLRALSLNFANGVVPGGGFLDGARAQEETLCRSSALFRTLEGDPMYDAHRQGTPYESSDWVILSPDVPVFRADDGSVVERWRTSFATCAAPYAPRVGQPRSGDLLARRIRRLLAVARAFGFDALVLGAWGCGAFGNDPVRTARAFREALEGEFDGAFRHVTFAVTDWSPDRRFLRPFRDAFSLEE